MHVIVSDSIAFLQRRVHKTDAHEENTGNVKQLSKKCVTLKLTNYFLRASGSGAAILSGHSAHKENSNTWISVAHSTACISVRRKLEAKQKPRQDTFPEGEKVAADFDIFLQCAEASLNGG